MKLNLKTYNWNKIYFMLIGVIGLLITWPLDTSQTGILLLITGCIGRIWLEIHEIKKHLKVNHKQDD